MDKVIKEINKNKQQNLKSKDKKYEISQE